MNLLSLPSELREQLWKTLCKPCGKISYDFARKDVVRWSYTNLLPLLLTCRTTHAETAPLLSRYTRTLELHEPWITLSPILTGIPSSIYDNIETLTLPFMGVHRRKIIRQLPSVRLIILVTESPLTDAKAAERDLLSEANILYELFPTYFDERARDDEVVLLRLRDSRGSAQLAAHDRELRITAVLDTSDMKLLKVEWTASRVVTGRISRTIVSDHGEVESWEDYLEAKKAMEERENSQNGKVEMQSL